MKLILAIVNNEDTARAVDALMKAGFFATRLSTTGGFLMMGNTTLLIGTDEARVQMALGILRQHCTARTQPGSTVMRSDPVTVGGATVFVLDVDHMEKF
jgi:uncharacterized protein YaaQ